MATTGDIKNNIEKLKSQLKSVQFSGLFDIDGLISGRTDTILPLLNYVFLNFSRHLSKYLITKGYDFHNKPDLKFVNTMYRLLVGEFQYRPTLSAAMFLSPGYAERKLIMCCDIIQLCKNKHHELSRIAQENVAKVISSETSSRLSKVPQRYKSETSPDSKLNQRKETSNNSPSSKTSQSHQKSPVQDFSVMLNSLSDNLSASLDEKFKEFEKKIDSRLSKIEANMTFLETKIKFVEEAQRTFEASGKDRVQDKHTAPHSSKAPDTTLFSKVIHKSGTQDGGQEMQQTKGWGLLDKKETLSGVSKHIPGYKPPQTSDTQSFINAITARNRQTNNYIDDLKCNQIQFD